LILGKMDLPSSEFALENRGLHRRRLWKRNEDTLALRERFYGFASELISSAFIVCSFFLAILASIVISKTGGVIGSDITRLLANAAGVIFAVFWIDAGNSAKRDLKNVIDATDALPPGELELMFGEFKEWLRGDIE
jgi:hypothetical protein